MRSKRAALVCASALALSGCDIPDWLQEIIDACHGGDGDGDGDGDADGDPGPACDDTQYAAGDTCKRKTVAVSAGVGYTCAILAGDELKCFGADSWYRLGQGAPGGNLGDAPGELGDALDPIPLGQAAVHAFADSDLTCAALADGSVKCFGYNGYGAVTNIPVPASVGDTVDLLPSHTFVGGAAIEVAAGSGTAYALLDDGSVVTWGTSKQTIAFGAGRQVVQFARSTLYDNYHYCALLDDGQIACKLSGSAGQLGRNPALDPPMMPPAGYPLVDLGTDRTALAVATGDAHTCALLDGGEVVCWGANGAGQLGIGSTVNRGLSPADMGDNLIPVPLGQPATAIALGRNHSCALLTDGNVKCWGQNTAGQLGQGSTTNLGDAPGEVAALAPIPLGTGRTAVAIDAGSHTCAILDDGSLKCWGANEGGQLGQGDVANRGIAPGQLGDALTPVDLGS